MTGTAHTDGIVAEERAAAIRRPAPISVVEGTSRMRLLHFETFLCLSPLSPLSPHEIDILHSCRPSTYTVPHAVDWQNEDPFAASPPKLEGGGRKGSLFVKACLRGTPAEGEETGLEACAFVHHHTQPPDRG